MLRFLSLTTALSAILIPFLPKVAFGLPPVGNINDAPTVILNPNTNPGTVIVNPSNSYPTGTTIYPNYPNSNSRTVIINPSGPVIVNPNNVNPNKDNQTSQQNSCSSVIYGSPIPRAVPINPNTGGPCR